MSEKLDWWMSWRLSREMRDLIADFALEDTRAKGSSSKMVRLMVEYYIEQSGIIPDSPKARADLSRSLRRKRLDEMELLRQDYHELLADPNPEEERVAQARAVELGMTWPPKAYSEIDLSGILLRLKRLWHTDSRSGSVSLRELRHSLRRRYDPDRLFSCLKELESRGELQVTTVRPIRILEIA